VIRIISPKELEAITPFLKPGIKEYCYDKEELKKRKIDIFDSIDNLYFYPYFKEEKCICCMLSDSKISEDRINISLIDTLIDYHSFRYFEKTKELETLDNDYSETLEAMTELLEELASLYELSHLIGKKVQTFYDFKKLADEIHLLISGCGIFNIDISYIGFIDPDNSKKWNISAKSINNSESYEVSSNSEEWLLFNDTVEYSLNKSHALILPADKSLIGKELCKSDKNILISPVVDPENKNIGALVLISNNEKFTEKHRNFINVISSQVSLVASLGHTFKKILSIQKLEREMELATEIQKKLLPKKHPFIVGWDIFGGMNTAREVGGDYFDYFIDHDENTVGIIIADVSGKGISASLVMATFRGIIRTIYSETPDMIKMFEKLNISIKEDVEGEKFVTAFFIKIDLNTGKATYVKAGHNPVILKRKGKKHELLEGAGLFVGMFDELMLEEKELILEEGDSVLLYTDGAIELIDENDNEYSLKKLGSFYDLSGINLNSHEIINKIFDELKEFKGELDWFDDVTMINIAKIPCSSGKASINSDNKELRKFSENFINMLENTEYEFINGYDTFNLRLIVDELVTNAIQHGNSLDPSKIVKINWKFDYRGIFIIVEDEGNGFDWEDEMRKSKIINLYKKRGRGMLICHNVSNTFFYNKNGNVAYLGIYWRYYEKNIIG